MARAGGGRSQRISPATTSGILVEDVTANERVRIGLLDSDEPLLGDYGIRVTSSDGSTVIIDGTSNMFKIIASGTMTITAPAASGTATNSVGNIATGLMYAPAFHAWIELAGATFADSLPFNFITTAGIIRDNILLFTVPEGDGETTVQVEWRTGPSGPAFAGTKTVRYYLMKETAL